MNITFNDVALVYSTKYYVAILLLMLLTQVKHTVMHTLALQRYHPEF